MTDINELHDKFDNLLHSLGLDLVNDISKYYTSISKYYTEDFDVRSMTIYNLHNDDDMITISIDKDDIISPLISTVRYELRTYYDNKKLIDVESKLSFTGVFTNKTIQKDIIVKVDVNYCSDGNIIWFSDCDLFFERVCH